MADDETIVFLGNYYTDFDPNDYYKDGKKLKTTKALPLRPVYVSDLIDQADCEISFGSYRNKDDLSAKPIIKYRTGIVQSYNPETKLLKIRSKKINPRIKKFNSKMRYVEPEMGKLDLSVHGYKGRSCRLTQTNCNEKPDCIKKLNDVVKDYNQRRKQWEESLKTPSQSLVKTVKGAGRRSRRNANNKKGRTSTRRRIF